MDTANIQRSMSSAHTNGEDRSQNEASRGESMTRPTGCVMAPSARGTMAKKATCHLTSEPGSGMHL